MKHFLSTQLQLKMAASRHVCPLTFVQYKACLTYRDLQCATSFERILQARNMIQNGLVLPNFGTALEAITDIEQQSDYLKHFLGYLMAKSLILEKYFETHDIDE